MNMRDTPPAAAGHPAEASALMAGRSVEELVADAAAALTAAARRARPGSGGRPCPVDFAEIACLVLATVVANRGGVEELLAGRPGLWEAEDVRRVVHSTVGDDRWALMWLRTVPIVLGLDPQDLFCDVGLEELYQCDTPPR